MTTPTRAFYHEWTSMLSASGFEATPLRPRYFTAKFRREMRAERPESFAGRMLNAYLKALSVVESVPNLGQCLTGRLFPLDREYVGGISYSCYARKNPTPSGETRRTQVG